MHEVIDAKCRYPMSDVPCGIALDDDPQKTIAGCTNRYTDFGGFDVLCVGALYRKHATRSRELAAKASTPQEKNIHQDYALFCDGVADAIERE